LACDTLWQKSNFVGKENNFLSPSRFQFQLDSLEDEDHEIPKVFALFFLYLFGAASKHNFYLVNI